MITGPLSLGRARWPVAFLDCREANVLGDTNFPEVLYSVVAITALTNCARALVLRPFKGF